MSIAVRSLETPRLKLLLPAPADAPRFAAYVNENEPHLARWEPPRPEGYFTAAYWEKRIERYQDELARDLAVRFALVRRDDPAGPVVGHCNFNQIVRGCFQACVLGYSVDHRWEGRGMMREALSAALPFMFDGVGLHRIMANYIPTNERSGRLLARLGFVVEGRAQNYLFIDGAWREHVLTSLTNPDPSPPGV
jgi:ribosomal-protein-alanine N-acetyltransferase